MPTVNQGGRPKTATGLLDDVGETLAIVREIARDVLIEEAEHRRWLRQIVRVEAIHRRKQARRVAEALGLLSRADAAFRKLRGGGS